MLKLKYKLLPNNTLQLHTLTERDYKTEKLFIKFKHSPQNTMVGSAPCVNTTILGFFLFSLGMADTF